LQQKNFILLFLFERAINKVSKRIKFQFVCKPSEKIDIMSLLIKNRSIYLTVEVFLSILIAIGHQTKRANKKFPKEEKINKPFKKEGPTIKNIIKTRKEPINIKKTVRGIL
jgi:hypothetical protein